MPKNCNCSHFQISLEFLRPMSEELSGQTFHTVSCGSPLIRVSFVATYQWASTQHHMEGLSQHNSSLISKNPAKFENYCISRNGHRIKFTQPNLMILVSLSSAENVLSNDVNKHNNSSQGTENPPFGFFWDTWYRQLYISPAYAYHTYCR